MVFGKEVQPPECPTDDRLDKLDAICTDLLRQLRDVRERARGDTMAGMAAKIEEIVDRLDGTDRRVEALKQGLNDAQDVVGKHEDRLNALETARAWIDTTSIYKRMQLYESALTGVGGLAPLYKKVEQLASRIAMVLGALDDPENDLSNRVPAHKRIDDTRQDVAEEVGKINARMSALSASLARVEDMLTSERLITLAAKPDVAIAAEVSGALPLCTCAQCDKLRREYKPKRVIKGGWINVYEGPKGSANIGALCESKVEADMFHSPSRVACIQIPDITEGEGL